MTHNDSTNTNAPVSFRFLRVLTFLGLASVLALLIVWATLGRTVVEKTATILVLPCGLIWYLLTCCLVLVIAGRHRKTVLATLLVWITYTVFGSGPLRLPAGAGHGNAVRENPTTQRRAI